MEDSTFLAEDGAPKFLLCAVLYLDMLGVSAMARGPDAGEELVRLDKTIRGAFPYRIGAQASEEESAYPAAVFSDSVVAAMPVQADLEITSAQAIFNLTFEAARIQAELAARDYFARGAITLGNFHFHDGLIFGPALVEAVELERSVAVDPRIVLSPRSTAVLRKAEREAQGGDVNFAEAPVLVDADGTAFVDYLTGALQADAEAELVPLLTGHQTRVAARLEAHASHFHRFSKHRWVAEYHNATCEAYQEQLKNDPSTEFSELLIDSIHTRRDFRALF